MALPLENCQYLGFQIAHWANLVVGATDRRQQAAATPAAGPSRPAGAAPVPPIPRGAAVMLCLLDRDLAPAALAGSHHHTPHPNSFLVISGGAGRPRPAPEPAHAAVGFDPDAPLPAGQTAADIEALWRNFHHAPAGVSRDQLLQTLLLTYWPLACRAARDARWLFALPEDDRRQECFFALRQAILDFNPFSGASFGSYCRLRLGGFLRDVARRYDPLPRRLRQQVVATERAANACYHRTGRRPAPADICAHDGPRRAPGYFLLVTARAPGGRPVEPYAQTAPAPTGDIDHRDLCEALCGLLPARQAAVFRALFFDQLSPKAAAGALGLSTSRLFELRRAALRALRESPRARRMLAHAATQARAVTILPVFYFIKDIFLWKKLPLTTASSTPRPSTPCSTTFPPTVTPFLFLCASFRGAPPAR